MKKYIKILTNTIIVFIGLLSFAQDSVPKITDDLKYREDQFYIGVTYNIIQSNTHGLSPEGLSGGVNFGFIRDMPINKKRNISIGVGAGVSLDQYGSNLFIYNDDNATNYKLLNESNSYKYNRFQTAIVEAPIEFRWRTSTPTSYKFWRAYLGFRVGYTFWHRSRFKDSNETISTSNISEYEKFRFGSTISVGYNKFNFFAYYSLNPFYKNATTINNNEKVDFKTLKLGLIFYIL